MGKMFASCSPTPSSLTFVDLLRHTKHLDPGPPQNQVKFDTVLTVHLLNDLEGDRIELDSVELI